MRNKMLFLFLMLPSVLIAQKYWSLEDCLKHAAENNLTIKQTQLATAQSKIALNQSKIGMLPSLNSSVSHAYNFGRTIDPYTNTFTVDRVRNNNIGLSSSVTLFAGFQNINNIRKSNFDYLAAKFDSEKIANDISLNIITAFLQLMYSEDLVKVNKNKLALSEQEVKRINEMVDVGRLPKGSLLETESQKAQEELQLINAQNQYEIAILNLKQLLDIDASTAFEILVPEGTIQDRSLEINTDDLYNAALSNLPDVKSAATKLKSAQRSLAIARGSRSPDLVYQVAWEQATPMPDKN